MSAFVLSEISSMWFSTSARAPSCPFGNTSSRSMSIVSQRYITLSASYKLFRKHIATHQRYRRLVQNLRPHLVHHIGIAGYTHVRYRRRERSSLHPRYRLRLARRDRSMYSLTTLLAHLPAQTPQVFHIARMYRQRVIWHVLRRTIGMYPFLKCSHRTIQHILLIRSREIRCEWHIERQIDQMPRHRRIRAHRRAD